jgi:hypothetical protein
MQKQSSSPINNNNRQPTSNNNRSPPTQQTAIEFLDSIFDKNDKGGSSLPQKEEFQSKKYDKSFFESNKFWEVPSIG